MNLSMVVISDQIALGFLATANQYGGVPMPTVSIAESRHFHALAHTSSK